jgi:hypothetical protein
MTGFAFEIFIGILNVSYLFGENLFMAFVAGDSCVLPVQGETGLAMIEINSFPVIKGMACPAVIDPFFLELPGVVVFVATQAGCSQAFKFLVDQPVVTFSEMAG